MNDSAVVLLSGGQDSTTVFYDALDRYDRVEAISFDYGQRHRVELDLAARTAHKQHVAHTTLTVEALSYLAGGSLTNEEIRNTPGGAPAMSGWHRQHGLPPSFVPGRNLLFFSLAAAYGIPRGHRTIVTGVCQQDDAGYPDCRADFVRAARDAVALAMDEPRFEIDAPLLDRSKAQTWELAARLGVLEEIRLNTHTCYEGFRNGDPAPWGYGCGVCGACVERAKGYDVFQQSVAA